MQSLDLNSLKTIKSEKVSFPIEQNNQLYFIKEKNFIFAYSPFFNYAAKLTLNEYNFLLDNKVVYDDTNNSYTELVGSFLYNNNNKNDLKFNLKPLNSIKNLTLALTNKCNLRCKYCFASDYKDLGEAVLNFDVIKSVIDKFNPESISFFGWGEPTLAFNTIKKILDYDKDIKTNIVTNGVYFSKRKELVKYMVDKKIRVSISFDSPPKINDNYRLLPDNNITSKEVLATIKEFKKFDYLDNVSVKMTVCGGMEGHILEGVKYLERLGFKKVSIGPAEIMGRAVNNIKQINPIKFADNISKAVFYGKKRDLEIFCPLFQQSSDKVMVSHYCGFVSGNSITLGTNHRIYMCDRSAPEFCIGSVEKIKGGYKVKVNSSKASQIINKRYEPRLKECEDCPVKCGGGCARMSYDKHKSLSFGGDLKEYCNTRRFALKSYIKLAFDLK